MLEWQSCKLSKFLVVPLRICSVIGVFSSSDCMLAFKWVFVDKHIKNRDRYIVYWDFKGIVFMTHLHHTKQSEIPEDIS